MSYPNQGGVGGNTGVPSSVQGIGSQIAGNQGGIHYENKPGASLSGGAAPERNTFQGLSGSGGAVQEPGYENITAPSYTSGGQSSYSQQSGTSAYGTNPLSSQGGAGQTQQYGTTPGGADLLTGSGTTGAKPKTGTASIAGGGINNNTMGAGGPSGNTSSSTTTANPSADASGVYQQAKEAAAPYVQKAQETVQPYVAQAQETVGPYVAQAQESVQPYVAQAQETLQPYVAKAQELGSAALESARPTAEKAYNAVATELDARGINKETTQQKLAEVGQTMKDYGAIGQQRAGEYLNQAVDQAKTIGQDRENKNIIATVLGTVALIWLAFGFSIGALFALGTASIIALILSRYSRGHGSSSSYSSQTGTGSGPGIGSNSSAKTGTGANLNTPGVETHFPRANHPDNSLNANPLK